MKQIRIIAMAAVAAMALVATVGAGTASATETSLCKQDTTISGLPICEEGHIYPAQTVVHANLEAGTKLIFEGGFGVGECLKSTLEFTTEQKTEIPLGANVNALTFGECQIAGGAAEITTVNKGTLDIEVIDLPVWTHDGTLTFTETEVKVVFAFGVECRYALGHGGILTGGAMATIDLVGNLVKVAGPFLCPAVPQVRADYTVISPEPLWVSM